MILRRVIAHVRNQEWTAIAIDFVIVVVGVFVGIQVANWNEREADKRLGRAYAERLTADIGKDLAARRALESGVTDYYAGDTARLVLETVSDSAYRHRVRTIIPLDLQKALREGCSDVRNEAQEIVGFMTDCKLEAASAGIEATAAALRSDAGIQAELRYQYSDVFSARANISGDVVFLERALLALQGAQSPAAESNP